MIARMSLFCRWIATVTLAALLPGSASGCHPEHENFPIHAATTRPFWLLTEQYYAGADRKEITPSFATAVGVHRLPMACLMGPIYARAVYLERWSPTSPPQGMVMVSCDLPYIPLGLRDSVFDKLSKCGLALLLSPDQVIIAATGNPNAPSRYATSMKISDPPWADAEFDRDYFNSLSDQISAAIQAACTRKTSAVVTAATSTLSRSAGWSTIQPTTQQSEKYALVNLNPQAISSKPQAADVIEGSSSVTGDVQADGLIGSVPAQFRYVDPTLDVIRIRRLQTTTDSTGNLIAVMAFLPFHETGVGPDVPTCGPSSAGRAAAILENTAAVPKDNNYPKIKDFPVVAVFESAGSDVALVADRTDGFGSFIGSADAANSVDRTLAGAIADARDDDPVQPLPEADDLIHFSNSSAFPAPAHGTLADGSDQNGDRPNVAPVGLIQLDVANLAVIPGHVDLGVGVQLRRSVIPGGNHRLILLANAAGDLGNFTVNTSSKEIGDLVAAVPAPDALSSFFSSGKYDHRADCKTDWSPACRGCAHAAAQSWFQSSANSTPMQEFEFIVTGDQPKKPAVVIQQQLRDTSIDPPTLAWKTLPSTEQPDTPTMLVVFVGYEKDQKMWCAYWKPGKDTFKDPGIAYRFHIKRCKPLKEINSAAFDLDTDPTFHHQ